MPVQEPDPDGHVFARRTAGSYSKKFVGKFLDKETIGPELIARTMWSCSFLPKKSLGGAQRGQMLD
jgi:hypothetical protein